MQHWLKEACAILGSTGHVTLVFGNKTDLSRQRQVHREEAEHYANSYGYLYYEGSAKTAENTWAATHSIAVWALYGCKCKIVVQYT